MDHSVPAAPVSKRPCIIGSLPGARWGVTVLLIVALGTALASNARAQSAGAAPATVAPQFGARGTDGALFVPRIHRRPLLDDFRDMRAPADLREQMARAENFVQRAPRDGEPARARTETWIGHDGDHLYVTFVAWDPEPGSIRARLARREDIESDDVVSVTLDTFRDQQRGYFFSANPLGIQRDGLWTEGAEEIDFSYDTLWDSTGTITESGYVVLMSIPFRSLRFPRADTQTWGIVLRRFVPRGAAEESTWPHVSARVEGTLNQAGLITGLEDVSPGRNIRLIPYGTLRSFRALGDTDLGPAFISDAADPAGGLDAKFVVKDSIVVDATVNPDFSQVESDQPQNTFNERFEVFFPEKRPFFLENASTFETPLNLLFTRRIADPRGGIRGTGKVGGWALGALAIDDRAPGLLADSDDPVHGKTARVGVLRVARDLPRQGRIGALWAERRLGDTFNRVASIDGRVKIDRNWVGTFQAVTSTSRRSDGTTLSGPAYYARLNRAGRQLEVNLQYTDIDEDFRSHLGFIPRTGVRRASTFVEYRFRPEGEVMISYGPGFTYTHFMDRRGNLLDRSYNPWVTFELTGQTNLGLFIWGQETHLGPDDYASLAHRREYDTAVKGFWFNTRLLESVELNTWHNRGDRVNFVPAAGAQPEIGGFGAGNILLTYRPSDSVRLSGRWLYSALDAEDGGRAIRSDIYRARVDWQITRELSLRLIAQFDRLAVDPTHTRLEDRRNLNTDILVTYLVNPWTVLFVGYNGNRQNLELLMGDQGSRLRRTDALMLDDSRQLFIKFSYLFDY